MSQATMSASARTRARSAGSLGNNGGSGWSLVEIFDDRHRLDQGLPAIFKRRNQTLRVDAAIIGRALIVAPQVDRRGVVSELFRLRAMRTLNAAEDRK